MAIGPTTALVVAAAALVLFGRGKVAGMMEELGQGLKSFRRGMQDEQSPKATSQISGPETTAVRPEPGPTVSSSETSPATAAPVNQPTSAPVPSAAPQA